MPHGMSSIPTYRRGRTVLVGDKHGSACFGYCGLFALAALSVTVNIFAIHALRNQFMLLSSFHEIKNSIYELSVVKADIASAPIAEGAYHFATSSIQATTNDESFRLTVPAALNLKRNTEYCQWHETSTDRCETCYREVRQENGKTSQESYSCNCVRTYHYAKFWGSYRINSLMFNQPASHYNPQRDPYPSYTFFSNSPTIEGSIVLEGPLVERIKGKPTYLNWGDTRGPVPAEVMKVYDSAAFQQHKFVYAGNGYFFSPYEISVQERLGRAFFQYIEGSLLDFQLGDLMPSCTAGDIRVSYYAVRPAQLSGLGRLNKDAGRVSLGLYTTPKAKVVGLLREGLLTSTQLMDAEAWDFKKMVYWSRLALFVWSFIPANLAKAYAGCFVPAGWTLFVLSAIGITGMISLGIQTSLTFFMAKDIGLSTRDILGLGVGFILSGLLFVASMREWQKLGDSRTGGFGPCKRLLYRYCGGPVEWYEAPYKPEIAKGF
jgi:hypothetical protein